MLRAGLCFAGLALAGVSLLWQHRLAERQAEMSRWLERIGVPVLEAGTETAGRPAAPNLTREPDPERVGLMAARAALAAEFDPSLAAARPPVPPAEAARASAARLAEIAQRAGAVLAAKPAAWDAAMILGASRYLSWSQGRDPRLFTRYRDWEAPLEEALRLSPGRRESVRFLAAAYLEIWPVLSPGKRQEARRLLAEVFRDPHDMEPLLEPWMETAGSLQAAFALVPDDPEAWRRVEEVLARRGDFRGWSAARQRRDAALLAGLRRDLDRAAVLADRGDLAGSRALFLAAAGRTRPEGRYRDILETALTRCPPGPVDRDTGNRLLPHLLWAVDRCLYGECALSATALKRLSFFAREAEPPERAMAALFAGDLPRAESFERQGAGFWNETWALYLIAKARRLAEGGHVEEARETLSLVSRSWQDRPLYWLAASEVARAEGDTGAAVQAEERLAALSRTAWPAIAWNWRRGVARLEILTARPGRLALALDQVPEGGGAVELRLDGTALGAFPFPPLAVGSPAGTGTAGAPVILSPAVPVGRGLHLLEIENLLGGRVIPGELTLR